jgi:predicted Zn-dependent peptidase
MHLPEVCMRRLLFVIILCLAAAQLQGQTRAEDVKTFTLGNGMKFLVVEDHSIPNASLYLFFRAGSRNEYPGITGLSHFFEHMMFNGAKKYGPKEFDRIMEASGGSNNAYTTENVTVYTDWFPASALDVVFDLEADRLGHLALDDGMIESERGVILSERTTGLENSNWELLEEQVKSVAYMAHPYRWSVIGYESDIRNWTKADLQSYFDTYYAPNNAVAVMTGDLDLAKAKQLAEEYFGSIPSHEPPRPVHVVEPEQMGEKRLVVHRDVTTPNIMIVYHVPETKSTEYYAIDVLSSVLSEGNSSRLYRSLVDEKQLAVSVTTYYPLAFDPTVLYVYAVAATGVSEDDLEAAIYTELDRVVSEGVTPAELEKVKNRKLVDFYHAMETISGKANTIGTYELFFGDYRKLFTAPEEYRKVTPGDIQAVAAKYLRASNRTVGTLKGSEES